MVGSRQWVQTDGEANFCQRPNMRQSEFEVTRESGNRDDEHVALRISPYGALRLHSERLFLKTRQTSWSRGMKLNWYSAFFEDVVP